MCIRREFSASAFAANGMVRSALASAFPLFTTQMFINVSFDDPSLLRTDAPTHVDGRTMGLIRYRHRCGTPCTHPVSLFKVRSTYSRTQSVCTLRCECLPLPRRALASATPYSLQMSHYWIGYRDCQRARGGYESRARERTRLERRPRPSKEPESTITITTHFSTRL